MIYYLAAGLGLIFLYSQKTDAERILSMGEKRLFDLDDVDSENQGGKFKRDFDLSFEKAADETGVPFALIKAHAFRESSFNSKAFRDENPSKRSDRIGWASRGLMQILWWPGSERFKKYGFADYQLQSGEKLYDPDINAKIGAYIIRDNLNSCQGNLRDAINMYNTGKKEASYQAPHDYVNRVLETYNTLLGR